MPYRLTQTVQALDGAVHTLYETLLLLCQSLGLPKSLCQRFYVMVLGGRQLITSTFHTTAHHHGMIPLITKAMAGAMHTLYKKLLLLGWE